MFPISLSEEVYKRLTMTWGPEVILRCKCTDWPSHSARQDDAELASLC